MAADQPTVCMHVTPPYITLSKHISRVYRVAYACTYIFFLKINGVGKPQKFSSELELACPSTKLFCLERFAIYGISTVSLMNNLAINDFALYKLLICCHKIYLKWQ